MDQRVQTTQRIAFPSTWTTWREKQWNRPQLPRAANYPGTHLGGGQDGEGEDHAAAEAPLALGPEMGQQAAHGAPVDVFGGLVGGGLGGYQLQHIVLASLLVAILRLFFGRETSKKGGVRNANASSGRPKRQHSGEASKTIAPAPYRFGVVVTTTGGRLGAIAPLDVAFLLALIVACLCAPSGCRTTCVTKSGAPTNRPTNRQTMQERTGSHRLCKVCPGAVSG